MLATSVRHHVDPMEPPFARKDLGQHFLRDRAVARRIVDLVDPQPGETVLEIGPGRGALTAPLIERAAPIAAVERDARLAAELRSEHGTQRLALLEQDVLELELATVAAKLGRPPGTRLVVVGNLHEMVATVGRHEGRQFAGTHGDGQLTDETSFEGNATNIDWPGIDVIDPARGVTGTVGSGYRGGDFQSNNIRHFQISTRSYAAKDPDSDGYNQRNDASFGIFGGGRLVRTAP